MEESGKRALLFDWLWFLTWGLASSVWCISASTQLSATFDEPVYVLEGLKHWRTGSYAGMMHLGTMPLPVDVISLPLYLWERSQGITLDAVNDLPRVLPYARAGTLVFWWLLLWYGRWAGRYLAGPWGGRLAVAWLAFEPNFLAHASLATTDISIAACMLAFVYHFRVGQDAGWGRRVGLPTIWFGLAILAKASGLAFGPVCMLALELDRIFRSQVASDEKPHGLRGLIGTVWRELRWRDLMQISLGGLVLTFLYCGSDWKPQASFVLWAHGLPDGIVRSGMVWLSEHLCIFSNAGAGLVRQFTHNIRGHGVYLLGREDPRALWYYFPVLMTIKVSSPLLLASLALLLFRPRILWNWAFQAALALTVFSVVCRVQIGIRFMLPLLAFAIVGISASLVQLVQTESIHWRRKLVQSGAFAGIAWTVCAALLVWPEGLCYINEFWGGTAGGYQKVSDANYDWGQGLKELSRWQRLHPLPLAVWYYGTDPALKSLPIEEIPLHSMEIQGPNDLLQAVRGRYLAVGTTILYGAAGDSENLRRAREILRNYSPMARTTTFLIFDFTHEGMFGRGSKEGVPAFKTPARK